jgi:hypothetical protein
VGIGKWRKLAGDEASQLPYRPDSGKMKGDWWEAKIAAAPGKFFPSRFRMSVRRGGVSEENYE